MRLPPSRMMAVEERVAKKSSCTKCWEHSCSPGTGIPRTRSKTCRKDMEQPALRQFSPLLQGQDLFLLQKVVLGAATLSSNEAETDFYTQI